MKTPIPADVSSEYRKALHRFVIATGVANQSPMKCHFETSDSICTSSIQLQANLDPHTVAFRFENKNRSSNDGRAKYSSL